MRLHFTDRNIRRAFVLIIFVAGLWYFRHLSLLLVFFVVFSRTIGALADRIAVSAGLKQKWAVLIAVIVFILALAGLITVGVTQLIAHMPEIRQGVDVIVETIRNSSLYHRYLAMGGHVNAGQLLEQGRAHAADVIGFAGQVGRSALFIFIALVFSIVFLFERGQLEDWRESMGIDSIPRILLRYFAYVADSIAITLKLQVIVAVVNAIVTIPVLFVLQLPGKPALVAMLVVTGLIPVVGGPVAGAVLMTLAYVTKGPVGLAIFVISTFILHKIESYFLNPRLTAKHVKLPGFVIITSLILFEHAFGLKGLFLSFPSLYVAAKIREAWVDPDDELRDEAETTQSMRGIVPKMSQVFRFKPATIESLKEAGRDETTPPSEPREPTA